MERKILLKMEKEMIIKEVCGAWKDKVSGSSVEYVKELRAGWHKRMKKL